MVARDACLGDKTINKHKKNIIINIKKVATFGGRQLWLGWDTWIGFCNGKLCSVMNGEVPGCFKK